MRGENNLKINNNPVNIRNNEPAGLPKTSNVARSNSLRSSSPPRIRRQHPNVPPPLPENEVLVMNQSLVPQHLPQYPTPNNTQTKLDYSNKFVSHKSNSMIISSWFLLLFCCIDKTRRFRVVPSRNAGITFKSEQYSYKPNNYTRSRWISFISFYAKWKYTTYIF